jgi:hypothetical protein
MALEAHSTLHKLQEGNCHAADNALKSEIGFNITGSNSSVSPRGLFSLDSNGLALRMFWLSFFFEHRLGQFGSFKNWFGYGRVWVQWFQFQRDLGAWTELACH